MSRKSEQEACEPESYRKRKNPPEAFTNDDNFRQQSIRLAMKAYDNLETQKALQRLNKYDYEAFLNEQWDQKF